MLPRICSIIAQCYCYKEILIIFFVAFIYLRRISTAPKYLSTLSQYISTQYYYYPQFLSYFLHFNTQLHIEVNTCYAEKQPILLVYTPALKNLSNLVGCNWFRASLTRSFSWVTIYLRSAKIWLFKSHDEILWSWLLGDSAEKVLCVKKK